MSAHYNQHFFSGVHAGASRSAGVLVPLIMELFAPRTVVDVGCGLGVWLRAFTLHGVDVDNVLGLDGDYVERERLVIPREAFRAANLAEPIFLEETFDLVICLEVAEHLPPERAARFVADLTRLAPLIVFSAAIPGQGGTQHVNERWASEWAADFKRLDYDVIDCLRDRVWDDARVEFWYAQNTLVFARSSEIERRADLSAMRAATQRRALDRVHPRLYARWVEYASLSVQPFHKLAPATLRAGMRAIRRRWTRAVTAIRATRETVVERRQR